MIHGPSGKSASRYSYTPTTLTEMEGLATRTHTANCKWQPTRSQQSSNYVHRQLLTRLHTRQPIHEYTNRVHGTRSHNTTLMMETVSETSDFTNLLTRLSARESFTELVFPWQSDSYEIPHISQAFEKARETRRSQAHAARDTVSCCSLRDLEREKHI